jgi:hypothetical protein
LTSIIETTSEQDATISAPTPSHSTNDQSSSRMYMLNSMLGELQSRVTEYPGYGSLHSDATRFHATATGKHDTSKFLVTQTWVTGKAFQSMVRDLEDIDQIRHELEIMYTTEGNSTSTTKTPTPTDSGNTTPAATLTVTSGVGPDFSGFMFDHHSTHKAASTEFQPSASATADAESGASSRMADSKVSGGIKWWIVLFGSAFGLFLL